MNTSDKGVTEKKGVFVDIDALFDTRLSLLLSISKKLTLKIIENGSYITRKKDNFDNLSYDIFNSLYRNRRKTVLSDAIPTPVFKLLREHYGDLVTDIKNTKMLNPYIYLNIYPYKLNLDEQDLLAYGLAQVIPNCNIKMVSMDYDDFSPDWIHDHVDTVFKYDTLSWVEYNMSNTKLVNNPITDIIFIAPAIVPGNTPEGKIDSELFKIFTYTANLVINLNLIDASNFSASIE
jgi:hypothetical protein